MGRLLDVRVADRVASVAAELAPRADAIAADISDVIERDVPGLKIDPQVSSFLHASAAENVTTIVNILRHGLDPDGVQAPNAALEYARRLAQRDVPASELIRAYAVGEGRFLHHAFEELLRQTAGDHIEGRSGQWMVGIVSGYIRGVVEQLVATYTLERGRWLQNRSALLTARVRDILDAGDVDLRAVEPALGYRLRERHLGLVVWMDREAGDDDPLRRLGRVAHTLAVSIGSRHAALFVPYDETTAWTWIASPAEVGVQHDALRAVLGDEPGVCVAAGEPAFGVDGFRRTHRQAIAAHVVALAAGVDRAVVTRFVDVAPIAAMSDHLASARAWVGETLGGLAEDSARHARLRETARVFLETGGSYTATAEKLSLHRNTAQYRIQKAEELRGRPLREGRLQVEIALLACHWLGRAVLPTSR